jgi:hypothetical protein
MCGLRRTDAGRAGLALMNVRSFTSDQLRTMLQLIDMAVAIRPELEAALRERGEPVTRPVARKERIGKTFDD